MQQSRPHHGPLSWVEHLTQTPYPTLFSIYSGLIIIFGLLYFMLSYASGDQSLSGLMALSAPYRLLNCLYFSIITSTTVGYGDLAPHGFSKLFVSIQSVSGFFIATILVAKLVAHRQDITLERIHKLTFEDVFQNMREGFYITRKDFDLVIHEIEDGKAPSTRSWENLGIAYRFAQSLLEDIPDLYVPDPHLYSIDRKRELLLLDAVRRTIERLDHLLNCMAERDISWQTNPLSAHELEELFATMETAIQNWKTASHYEDHQAFDNLAQMWQALKEKTQKIRTIRKSTKKKLSK